MPQNLRLIAAYLFRRRYDAKGVNTTSVYAVFNAVNSHFTPFVPHIQRIATTLCSIHVQSTWMIAFIHRSGLPVQSYLHLHPGALDEWNSDV